MAPSLARLQPFSMLSLLVLASTACSLDLDLQDVLPSGSSGAVSGESGDSSSEGSTSGATTGGADDSRGDASTSSTTGDLESTDGAATTESGEVASSSSTGADEEPSLCEQYADRVESCGNPFDEPAPYESCMAGVTSPNADCSHAAVQWYTCITPTTCEEFSDSQTCVGELDTYYYACL